MRTLIVLTFILSVLKSHAYTGEVIKSFAAPADYPSGLTFDGENLWTADFKTDKIYKINFDGKVLKSIESPAYWPSGLTWDGKYLWCSDVKGLIPQGDEYHRGKIYKIDPLTGDVLHTIDAPTSSPVSITWDGKYLWCIDDIADKLIRFDPGDGTTISEYLTPSRNAAGITFDGEYLWISDRGRDEIYMVDPENGNVILICKAPGKYAKDLAFDGKYLWNVDFQTRKIYKMIIKDSVKYIRSNKYVSHMIYDHVITNFGPGLILTADVHIALPVNRVNQQINSAFVSTPEARTVTDNWGQKTMHYSYENIPAGEKRESVLEYDFTTWDVNYFIYPDRVKGEIPAEIKEKYLVDNAKYLIGDSVIVNAVKAAVGNERNIYKKMRKIFNYLIANMYYERVGGWNTAPTVLARGNGSCSEYSFVFISMCRAAGIPARYVGSVARRGDDRSIDDVFHRWVEVYLPGYGWIPVDPSGGDRKYPADQASHIGHLSHNFIITTQSGGGSTSLGWNYNSDQKYVSEAKTNVAVDYWGEMDKKQDK